MTTSSGATKGIWVEDIKEGNQIIEPLRQRLLGRFPVDDIKRKSGDRRGYRTEEQDDDRG